MEEKKVCKECGRELPIESFQMTRNGGRLGVCKNCMVTKQKATFRERKNRSAKKRIIIQTPTSTAKLRERFRTSSPVPPSGSTTMEASLAK